MKRIFTIGSGAETNRVCEVFRSIHAGAQEFASIEEMVSAAGESAPQLVVVCFDLATKSDAAVRDLRLMSSLRTVPVLVFYPGLISQAESRARNNGADEAAILPVERRDLLTRSARLLRIEKRRQFKTLLAVEAFGRSVMATSDDFSPTGLSFITDGVLDEDEQVKIHLFLPGETQRLSLSATIARRLPAPENRYFYGAQFSDKQEGSLAKVVDFIDRGTARSERS